MDTLTHYREILRKITYYYASFKPMHTGWDGERRVHGCVTLPTDKSEGFCGTHGFTTPTLTHQDPSDPLRSTETAIERHEQYRRIRSIMQERLIAPGIKAGALRRGTVIHMDIINGKIWIQYDGTNHLVADELLEAGVPREDIVLAFHPEYVCQYADFAVN